MTTKRTCLTVRQSWLLCNYLAENYTSSKMNDTQFAKKASEELGFDVSVPQLGQRRREMEIPSFTEMAKEPETVIERVRELEKRVLKLEELFK